MLKVKKQIKQLDGTVIEIEGTEAEVEAYEKKVGKKQQSEQAKKERKLLLESQKTIDKMSKKELIELIQAELAKQASRVEHHWYHHDGWWWKPHWDFNRWTYIYTQQNPNAGGIYITDTCDSIIDLTKTTGIGLGNIYSCMASSNSSPFVPASISGDSVPTSKFLQPANGNDVFGTVEQHSDERWKLTGANGNNLVLNGGTTFMAHNTDLKS